MRLLRVPGFAPLLAGQSINAIGNWVAIIAIWGSGPKRNYLGFRVRNSGAGEP